jgi:hypothetical protein
MPGRFSVAVSEREGGDTMPSSLKRFFSCVEELCCSAIHPYDARYTRERSYNAPLANVLLWRYEQEHTYLVLDALSLTWDVRNAIAMTSESCLIIEVPILTSRMHTLLREGQEARHVLNIADLETQLKDWVTQAYRRRFGP